MMRRRSTLALSALLVLAALPAMAVPTLARDAVHSQHDRTVAYWTPARLQSATPRDFIKGTDGTFRPTARPGTGGGGVAGAAWPNNQGQVYRTVGKVFFAMAGGNWVCSGAVATDGSATRSLVLTAGHCAYDEVNRRFATNWMFIPQYDSNPTTTCANTAFGCWTATSLVVHNGYATAGSFNTQATVHDFAFAVVGTGTKGTQLDSAAGSYGVTTAGGVGEKRYAFGYPAAGKYKGTNLTYCANPIFEDPYNDELTWGMTCDMTGGSSGGPWLRAFDESSGVGVLSSLNSYGYSGVKAMHGPKFNQDTLDVYNSARTATANTIVP
jgi:V8-like Glu-specific endopeptidase